MDIHLIGYSPRDARWLASTIRKAAAARIDELRDGTPAIYESLGAVAVKASDGSKGPFIMVYGDSRHELRVAERVLEKAFESQSHAAASHDWNVKFVRLSKFRRF